MPEVRGRRQGLTGHKVPKANGGDGDEGIVEALDVVPFFCHHEHKGRDHQVDQDAPHDEDGRTCDLSLPLAGLVGKQVSCGKGLPTSQLRHRAQGAPVDPAGQASPVPTPPLLCHGPSHPLTLCLGLGTYQAHSSPGKELAQPLCTSPEELAQGTDPCQAQWHPEQAIEDTEEAPSWGLGSHIAITCEGE